MSQRGGGRGRASHGRAQKQQVASSSQQEQQLPHAQPSTSSGAVRRPGTQLSTGRGSQKIGEKGDSSTVGQIGRGMEKLTIQPIAGGSGDADTAIRTGAVVSSARGAARGKRTLPADVITKPEHVHNKRGTSGITKKIKTNYFKLIKSTDWSLCQYHVDFLPAQDVTIVRKGLLRTHRNAFGAYIYDGTVMYTSRRLFDRNVFTSILQSDNTPVTITVRLVGALLPGDPTYMQFFNIIMRKCYEQLHLKLIGRNYFDPANRVEMRECNLELWPGYVSSIRQHERDILMCVEIINKVMRIETLLDILNKCFSEDRDRFRDLFTATVVNTVVLTAYNNNTYRIEDVNFDATPNSRFQTKDGKMITYAEYYKNKYDINISNLRQPLLITRSRLRERQAIEPEPIYLVPELCRATGLTDAMRDNFRLMSTLATETRLQPGRRIEKLLSFNRRLCGVPAIMQEFSNWDLQLDDRLLEVDGRELGSENLYFGGNQAIRTERGDWTKSLHNKACVNAPALRNWIFFITERDRSHSTAFITTLTKVSLQISFSLSPPKVIVLRDDKPGTYNQKLEEILSKEIPQLVFCVVSNNRVDRYSAIKKKCCLDRPVPSQVCMFRTMTHKNVMSIATKIAIQMNCKIGGAPWFVELPIEGMMTVGFDVCHDTTMKNKDFGATVATMNKQMTKYFSAVNMHENGEELSRDLADNICRAAKAYREVNRFLPARIVIYRDGVGEGQIAQVKQDEVERIKKKLNELYDGPKYKMAFIIVTKRLNTRFFCNNDNPDPGTIVDDVITCATKYDFFIVSQKVRQGTVTPTAYNVIEDSLGLDPDKIQRMTYKLTYMYYNCTNTVRVPAPCHYAHKLAFLVSKFIHRPPNMQLQNTLYFL